MPRSWHIILRAMRSPWRAGMGMPGPAEEITLQAVQRMNRETTEKATQREATVVGRKGGTPSETT